MKNFYGKLNEIFKYVKKNRSDDIAKLEEYLAKTAAFFDTGVSRLDDALKERKKSEIYMLYLLPLMVVGYLAFELLIPYGEKRLQESRRTLKNIEKNIENYTSKVASTKGKTSLLKDLDKKNSALEDELEEIQDKNAFISSKIDDELDFIRFSSKNWSEYLFEITEEASKNQIAILNFSNTIESGGSADEFVPIMNIDINGTGNYANMMRFLNSMERNQRIVEFDSLSIRGGRVLTFALSLNIWGVR